MLLAFIVLYVPISYFFVPTTFYDNHFILFISGFILMYPAHKFLHYLPVAHLGSKIKKSFEWKLGIIPVINIRVHEPISKPLFLIALLLPFISITTFLFAACFLFEHYVHYITILIAFQIGLSVPDFICAKNILRAPKQSYIEENEDGFEILIVKNQ